MARALQVILLIVSCLVSASGQQEPKLPNEYAGLSSVLRSNGNGSGLDAFFGNIANQGNGSGLEGLFGNIANQGNGSGLDALFGNVANQGGLAELSQILQNPTTNLRGTLNLADLFNSPVTQALQSNLQQLAQPILSQIDGLNMRESNLKSSTNDFNVYHSPNESVHPERKLSHASSYSGTLDSPPFAAIEEGYAFEPEHYHVYIHDDISQKGFNASLYSGDHRPFGFHKNVLMITNSGLEVRTNVEFEEKPYSCITTGTRPVTIYYQNRSYRMTIQW